MTRRTNLEDLGGAAVATSPSSMQAEHDGEQGSLDEVALAVVVVAVLGDPLHVVIVLHSEEVLVWTEVLVPEVEVKSWTFWVHIGMAFGLHDELDSESEVFDAEFDDFDTDLVAFDAVWRLFLLFSSSGPLSSAPFPLPPPPLPLTLFPQPKTHPRLPSTEAGSGSPIGGGGGVIAVGNPMGSAGIDQNRPKVPMSCCTVYWRTEIILTSCNNMCCG
jgi:hypothetical protein